MLSHIHVVITAVLATTAQSYLHTVNTCKIAIFFLIRPYSRELLGGPGLRGYFSSSPATLHNEANATARRRQQHANNDVGRGGALLHSRVRKEKTRRSRRSHQGTTQKTFPSMTSSPCSSSKMKTHAKSRMPHKK